MNDRSHLLTRKADLLAALALLQQDYEDGVVDGVAYEAARHRYEGETAQVLEQLDGLPEGPPLTPNPPPKHPLSRFIPTVSSSTFGAAAGVLITAALAIFLLTAIHQRGQNGPLTGDIGESSAKTASPRVIAAERQVRAHPRSVTALVNLGNAYLGNGQPASADASYQAAMKEDGSAPQPATLHAMMLGYAGHRAQALNLLHQVEAKHPTYSRPWLLDGLFAAYDSHRYSQAIRAWKRFLVLQPHGVMTRQVRRWMAGVRKAERRTK